MKIANYLLLNFLCAVFLTATRIISYACFFDGTFFTDSNIFTVILIVIMAIPLVFAFVNYIKNRKLTFKLAKINITVLAITSMLVAFALAFAVYYMYNELITANVFYSRSPTMIGLSFDMPLFVLSVVLLMFFVFITILFFAKKRSVLKKYKIFASVLPVWAFFFILYSYIHNNSSLLISENLFNMLIPCFIAISLIELSKLLCDLDQSETALKKLLLFFGVSFVLNVGYFASNLVLMSCNVPFKADLPLSVQIITISISLFTTVFILQTKYKINCEKKD